jgi:hypothetical protein
MFLEIIELSKLYVKKRAFSLSLNTCLVQLFLQEYVLSLILDRERGNSYKAGPNNVRCKYY